MKIRPFERNEGPAIPNSVIDEVMPQLSPAAWKVFLYLLGQAFSGNCTVVTVSAERITRNSGIESTTTVFKAVSQLINFGLVKRSSLDSGVIVERIKQKKPQHLPQPGVVCEWCGGTTAVLQQHHYPVPASEGGKETVEICGCCHAEFHYLQTCNTYELTL